MKMTRTNSRGPSLVLGAEKGPFHQLTTRPHSCIVPHICPEESCAHLLSNPRHLRFAPLRRSTASRHSIYLNTTRSAHMRPAIIPIPRPQDAPPMSSPDATPGGCWPLSVLIDIPGPSSLLRRSVRQEVRQVRFSPLTPFARCRFSFDCYFLGFRAAARLLFCVLCTYCGCSLCSFGLLLSCSVCTAAHSSVLSYDPLSVAICLSALLIRYVTIAFSVYCDLFPRCARHARMYDLLRSALGA